MHPRRASLFEWYVRTYVWWDGGILRCKNDVSFIHECRKVGRVMTCPLTGRFQLQNSWNSLQSQKLSTIFYCRTKFWDCEESSVSSERKNISLLLHPPSSLTIHKWAIYRIIPSSNIIKGQTFFLLLNNYAFRHRIGLDGRIWLCGAITAGNVVCTTTMVVVSSKTK